MLAIACFHSATGVEKGHLFNLSYDLDRASSFGNPFASCCTPPICGALDARSSLALRLDGVASQVLAEIAHAKKRIEERKAMSKENRKVELVS